MILGFFALAFILVVLLFQALVWTLVGVWEVGAWVFAFIHEHRQARLALIAAETERKRHDLQVAVQELTETLGNEAHEVRRQLIRESFRASGQLQEGPPLRPGR